MSRNPLLRRISPHVSRGVFIRGFLLFLLAATIPSAIAALLLVRESSRHLLARAEQTVEVLLQEETRILERRTDEVDGLVVQLIADPGVRRYLTDQFRSVSRVQTMLDVFAFVNLATQNKSGLADSVYLFDDLHDTVLTGTLYKKADFPDRSVLDSRDSRSVYVTAPVREDGADLVRYVRRFGLYEGVPNLSVVVVLKVDGLLGDLAFARSPFPLSFAVYTDAGQLVFSSDPALASLGAEEIPRILTSRGDILRTSRGQFFVRSAGIERLSWRLVCFQPIASLLSSSRLTAGVVVSVLAVVIVLSLGAAYILANFIYRPLARLATSFGAGVGERPATNEYGLIRQAFARLEDTNRELDSKFRGAYPYLRDLSVSDLLAGRPAGSGRLPEVLALLGVSFPYGRYILALADFGHHPFTDALRVELGSELQRYAPAATYVVSRDGDSAALVTLNTDSDASAVAASFREIHRGFASRGTELTIAVGSARASLEELPAEYGRVRRTLNDSFFTGRNRVAVCGEDTRLERPAVLDRHIEGELVRRLQLGDREGTMGALDRLTSDLAARGASIELVRYAYFQLMSDALEAMEELGVEVGSHGFSLQGCFEAVREAETLERLGEYVRSSLGSLLELRHQAATGGRSRIVAGAIRFLEDNYHRNIDLGEVGQAVYLNPRYLARLFKAETGRTVFEYLTDLRMDVAAAQLEDTLRVKDIARSVGYGSVQSFLRHFKRHYGTTPLQYRRSRFASRATSGVSAPKA